MNGTKLDKDQNDTIKKHLLSTLHKYSDADSGILSDYIIALLAKDGDEEKMKSECESELSAFMNDKTKQFVQELFHFIKTHVLKTNHNGNHNGNHHEDKTNGHDGPRPTIRHKRTVQLQSNADSNSNTDSNQNDLIIITRNSEDIKTNGNNEQPQQDFNVSTTPTPPNSTHNKTNHINSNDHDDVEDLSPSQPSKYNNGNSSYPNARRRQYGHNNYQKGNRKYNHNKNQNHNKNNNNNKNTPQYLLELLLQQQKQYEGSNKSFVTRRSMQNAQINALNALSSINPTLLTSYVPRPIIQRTPTPNIIQQPQPQKLPPPHQSQQQQQAQSAKAKEPQRLPPSDNPFYQDDRFKAINKSQPHQRYNRHPLHNKHVGKKRNFSNMNNNEKGKGKDKDKETEKKEKRQLFVYNIPCHLNTMTRLSSHFQQFGDIQHIQVHRDLNKAYVQFSSHEEALAALSCPDDILGEDSIKTTWAHYNRRDFDRNARNNHHVHSKNNNNNKKKNEEDKKPISHQWVSQEYKDKEKQHSLSSPPAKKQKLSTAINVNAGESETETTKIPKDVSENITKLRQRLTETMKMYEKVDEMEDNTEKVELKNTLQKTMENIESQMMKLLAHQQKRNEILQKLKKEKAEKVKATKPKYQRSTSYRGRRGGRGRGGYWTYGGYGGYSGYGGYGGYSSWRGGKNKNHYRTVTRKTKTKPHGKQKVDLSGKSYDFRSTSLMIENIPNDANIAENDLRAHFLRFGEVESTQLLSKDGKICGKVQFKKRADAEKAVIMAKQFKSGNDTTIQLKLKFVENEDLTS